MKQRTFITLFGSGTDLETAITHAEEAMIEAIDSIAATVISIQPQTVYNANNETWVHIITALIEREAWDD